MSLRRLRLAPFVLAVVALLALGWGAGAAPGWTTHGVASGTELVSSLHLEAPAVAAGAEERLDTGSQRLPKSRWAPLAVAIAAAVAASALRRRHRADEAVLLAPAADGSPARGRAPPSLLVPAH